MHITTLYLLQGCICSNVMAAAKVVNLETLIKHDIMPESSSRVLDCDKNCTTSENPAERSELIDEITPQDTQ